jgi:alpha-ketoglutarate-dependent taurine dioxygenase
MVSFPEVNARDIIGLATSLKLHRGVFVTGLTTRTSVVEMCEEIGVFRIHPDSDEDNLTSIEDRGYTRPGKQGFSSRPLFLHSDRSSEDIPPALLLQWCEYESPEGGETVFCDSKIVYRELETHYPEELEILHRPILEVGDVVIPIFQHHGNKVFVRYRMDDLTRPVPTSVEAISKLTNYLQRYSWTVKVPRGWAYIINNGSILHGRKAFTGPRRMLRGLFDPHPKFEYLSIGFSI